MSLPLATVKPERLYYLDWLRVLAMIGIFLFHNARFYDVFSDWHIRNATTALGPSILVGFMSVWIMPLFFLIAGAGTYFAFTSKKAGAYAGERSLRLLVPLIFGMLIIVPPQAYLEALFHGADLSGYNLLQVYLLYVQTLPELNFFHLWFLVYLFIFSVAMIPVFAGSGRSIISRTAARFSKPWTLFLLLIPGPAGHIPVPGRILGEPGHGGMEHRVLPVVLRIRLPHLR